MDELLSRHIILFEYKKPPISGINRVTDPTINDVDPRIEPSDTPNCSLWLGELIGVSNGEFIRVSCGEFIGVSFGEFIDVLSRDFLVKDQEEGYQNYNNGICRTAIDMLVSWN